MYTMLDKMQIYFFKIPIFVVDTLNIPCYNVSVHNYGHSKRENREEELAVAVRNVLREQGMLPERNVLRGEMAKYRVTIAQLAEVVGISANSMSAKLNGKVDFTLSEIRKILAFFNAKGENHTVETLFDI